MKNSDRCTFPNEMDGYQEEFGLTKREYFAAKAMQSLLNTREYQSLSSIAFDSIKMADILLEELEK